MSLQVQPDGGMYNELIPEMEANARLIASAPELLESLKEVTASLRSLMETAIQEDVWYAVDKIALSLAETVIAKATGK
jgi:hypothetical protein